MKRFPPLLCLMLLAGCAPAPAVMDGVGDAIAVQSQSIPLNRDNPAQNRIGRLRYLGGLWLQSRDRRFGGLSGLRWHDGKLYAISDAGDWFVFTVRENDGRLTGIGQARIRHLHGLDGRPLQGKRQGDSESLNLCYGDCGASSCPPVTADIGFEQQHRVWSYRLTDGMPEGAARPVGLPPQWLARQPANGGLEAIAGRNGVQLAISEEMLNADGRNAALVFAGSGWENAGVAAPHEFRPTDADYLGPSADGRGDEYLVLFRRYSLSYGIGASVGLISVYPDADAPARISPTEEIAKIRSPYNIDNMEGLAVRHEGAVTYLYMVSDDNFSGLQRTLLLKFKLLPK